MLDKTTPNMQKEMKKEEKKKGNGFFHSVYFGKRTFGQKAADSITKWAGSWTFIIAFLALVVLWMFLNAYILFGYYNKDPFDPYPFILLNLALSLLAAIQAPVILMSQNRQGEKDRIRTEYDYATNRRAEREIVEMKKQLDRIERKLLGKNTSTRSKSL